MNERNLRIAKFLNLVFHGKDNYDPNQPRDKTGKWTATGSEWEKTYRLHGPEGESVHTGFIPLKAKIAMVPSVDKDGKPIMDPLTGKQKVRPQFVDAKGKVINKNNPATRVFTTPTGQKVPAHAYDSKNISPGLKGVMINPDPKGKVQVAFVDKYGKPAATYSKQHTADAGSNKFDHLDRGRAAGDFKRMEEYNTRVLKSSKIDTVRHENALALAIMNDAGPRLGGSTDKKTKKGKWSYEGKGVYDLQVNDFKEKNGKLYMHYVPDKPQTEKDKTKSTYGKPLKVTVPINDPKLADVIRRKIAYETKPSNAKEHKNPSNPHLLYATTPSAIRKYMRSELSSPKVTTQVYRTHNFRHNVATSMGEKIASHQLKVHGRFNSESTYQKWLTAVMATHVSKQIPDTPKQLMDSYISPSVYRGLLAPNATKDLSSKGKLVYGHHYPSVLKK